LFVALCVLGLLCVGSVAFLPYPRFPSAFSAASAVRSAPLLPLCSIRNPQSTIRNLPSPRPRRTGPQPKFHTVYGHRTGFDPPLMVWPDAWHLIIFRASGGKTHVSVFAKMALTSIWAC
jgi:hypothetical protein